MAEDRLHLFADYALDRARGCLLRSNRPVHLRPQSYHVLEYLAANRGRLVGKEDLIQEVWQGRSVGDDSLVQCLRDVRQALGDETAQLIRTVRGRGYIFDIKEAVEAGPQTITQEVDFLRVVIDEEESNDRRSSRSLWTAGLLLAAALSLAGGAYAFLFHRSSTSLSNETIAVLPFVNQTGDSNADYLADGMTESLINALAQIPSVSVKARSSVSPYSGVEAHPQRIAADLGVNTLVYGRVVRHGDNFVVYLSAVDGRNGNQLWGNEYTRQIASLPSLQRDIVSDVARRLRASVSRADRERLIEGYTPTADAYQLYLRGRYHARRTTEADLRAAIELYRNAITADPSYALAHAGLAEAYRALSIVGRSPSMEAFPLARASAVRALELDNRLAEARIALGWILFSYDWDWVAAERELQAAIELSPRSADAHRAYAHLLSNLGRHEEAIVEARRARDLDPRSLLVNALEGQFLFYAGRLDEAEDRFRKTLQIEPAYWVAHQGLGRVSILRNHFDDAISAFRRGRELSSGATEVVTQLGFALARSGQRDDARAILRDLDALSSREYVPAYSFAMILNGLDEREAALRRLEQSVDQREVQATFLKIDTRWDALRTDPRFVALLKRLNLG